MALMDLTSMVEGPPKSLGSTDPHPGLVNAHLAALPWVRHDPGNAGTVDLMAAREACRELHWEINDLAIIPVRELSPLLRQDTTEPDDV